MISHLSFINTFPNDFLTNSSKSLIKEFTISGRNYKIISVCLKESGDNYSIRLKFYGKIPHSIHQEEVKKLEIYLENNSFKVGSYLITLEEINK